MINIAVQKVDKKMSKEEIYTRNDHSFPCIVIHHGRVTTGKCTQTGSENWKNTVVLALTNSQGIILESPGGSSNGNVLKNEDFNNPFWKLVPGDISYTLTVSN